MWMSITKTVFISIHSLVKRETVSPLSPFAGCPISIHSLVKRETVNSLEDLIVNQNFNPLPRKEGDYFIPRNYRKRPRNFNPLPRKEGDAHSMQPLSLQSDFNPLPRKEGDSARKLNSILNDIFQSTPS